MRELIFFNVSLYALYSNHNEVIAASSSAIVIL